MRHFQHVIRAFTVAACITTLAACEDAEPPRHTTVSVAAPVATPPPAPKPEVRVAAPTPPAAPTPAPTSVASDDEVDTSGKAGELIERARQAMDKGELDHALTLARIATKKAPNRAGAWNTLGRVQLKRGQRKDAIASFQKAVELNPSSSYAQNNLGLALIYDGQYDEAVAALEEATQLEPVEGYMWNNLGMAYEHLDRLDEARDAYQQAVELKAERAQQNLTRLAGVKTIKPVETAKADLPTVSDGAKGDEPKVAVPTPVEGAPDMK